MPTDTPTGSSPKRSRRRGMPQSIYAEWIRQTDPRVLIRVFDELEAASR